LIELRLGGSGTGGQGPFLTRILAYYQAYYQAILDISTYLSLNKLLGAKGAREPQDKGKTVHEASVMAQEPHDYQSLRQAMLLHMT
jgi:hypothetical protein